MDYPGNYLPAWEDSLKQFAAGNPCKMAELSQADFEACHSYFTISYFNRPYRVTYPSGEFNDQTLPVSDRILILQYLSNACGAGFSGGWIAFKDLPNGMHHNMPFIQEALLPLARVLGSDAGLLEKAAAALGAVKMNLGTLAFQVQALPKIPLALVCWLDDQQKADYNILFDRASTMHLDTAGLYMLGISFSRQLLEYQRS